MSININSYSSISGRKGISGLMSGLDTDDLVKQLTSSTRSKITKQLQNKQVISWKQNAYQNVSSQMNSFYNKYFQFSSSSSSILSEKFFSSSSITSSSSNVTATGNSQAVENVVIKDIQQLASKTAFTSSHQVSTQELSSGTIYNSWENNTIAGSSISLSYGGTTQKLTISNDFYLDSHASEGTNITKVVDELNAQISKNLNIKEKLEFSVDGTGNIKLSQIGAEPTNDLKIVDGSNNLLTSLGLYKTQEPDGLSEIAGANKLEDKSFFETNRFASSYVKLNVDGATNDSYLSLKTDFRFTAGALEKDAGGSFTTGAKALQKQELQDAYATAVSSNTSLKDKISVSINDSLEMTITSLGADGKIKVTGGNEKFLAGLGFSVTPEGEEGTTSVTGTIDVAKAIEAETKQLSETLSGTTLTLSLNGVSKKISFNESEKDQFSTVSGLKTYLQDSIDKQYGAGKVTVSETAGKLSFEATDPSHIITVQNSSASGILGENGALHMISGESNRLEYIKTIDQIKDTLTTPLVADADGKYKLSVNGKTFEFTGDTMLGDVISTINRDAEVGVTISYSSVTDKFSVMADEMGAQSKVDIEDVGTSNLGLSLFGTKGNAADGYEIAAGEDFRAVMSFDGGKNFSTVNRSTNSFEMDGVTFDVKGMEIGEVEENITFKTNSDVDGVLNKVKEFITEYNKIIENIQGKVTEKRYGVDYGSSEKYLPLTDEQKEEMSDKEVETWEEKAQIGLLRNDSTLNTILSKMRRAMSDVVGDSGSLYQLGITTGNWKLGGMLSIDEDKLRKSISEDPNKVSEIFTSENGIASNLQSVLQDAVIGSAKGQGTLISLAGKTTSSSGDSSALSRQISNIDKTVTSFKNSLKSEETRWYSKFTALESLIAKMNSQSEYFSSLGQ